MTKAKTFEGVSVRTNGDELEVRFERVLAEMAKRNAGVAPKKNTLARQAMLRGLQAIEQELGLAAK